MMRKAGMVLGACALALVMTVPAGAAQARVKGKFVVPPGQDPKTSILGSAKVKPMPDGTWRTGLTLQHVFRSDLSVYVATFVDSNGNGLPDLPSELRGPTLVPDCKLDTPSKKGHEGCVGYATLEGRPYDVALGAPQAGGVAFVAHAPVK